MNDYENDFDDAFSEADKEFKSKYKNILEGMRGYSPEELQEITPNMEDKETLKQLIAVMQEATDKNLATAELRKKILKLGDNAVKIAGKIPSLKDFL